MKRIIQNFEDFSGLDYRSTDLTREREFYKDLQNYQYGEGSSLVGRFGTEMIAAPKGQYKLHTYIYFDAVTGETVEELLAVGPILWRLKTATLNVARDTSGGIATAAIEVTMKQDRGEVYLYEDGAKITLVGGSTDGQLGYGHYNPYTDPDLPGKELPTIYDLAEAIDALTGWTCAVPDKSARLTTTTLSSSAAVDTGHTISAGDYIAFPPSNGFNSYHAGKILATAAGSLTLYRSMRQAANMVIGIGSASVAGLVKGSQAITPGSSVNLEFSYWEPVPWEKPDYEGADARDQEPHNLYQDLIEALEEGEYEHPHVVNASQNAYIFSNKTPTTVGYNKNSGLWRGHVHKYDGHAVYRAGLPPMKCHIPVTYNSGSLSGTYKYSVRWVQIDNRGIRWEGNPSSIYADYQITATPSSQVVILSIPELPFCVPDEDRVEVNGNQSAVTSATVHDSTNFEEGDVFFYENQITGDIVSKDLTGVAYTALTNTTVPLFATSDVNDGDFFYKNPHMGFNHQWGVISSNQTGVTTIAVSSEHPFFVGDTIFFYDNNQGKFTSRVLTSVTRTSVTFTDGPAVSVSSAKGITKNLFAEIYRTEDGGSLFYFCGIAIPGTSTPYSANSELRFLYVDTVVDADLGELLIEPDIGREHDLPPKARIATLHQGSLVASGDPEEPNTIYPADIGGVEYFPTTKAFDIPSAQTGPITGIASDSEDRLAVFKDNAYYDVQGDLLFGSIVAVPVTEGDYGISSQASIAKVNEHIFGLGRLGFVVVKNGEIITEISENINPAFLNNTDLFWSRATAVNDYTTRQYLCYVPKISTWDNGGGDGELMFAYDYEQGGWFNLDYGKEQVPSGGMAIYDKRFHFTSLYDFSLETEITTKTFARGYALRRTDLNTAETHRFWDVTQGLDYIITPQPWHLGSPSVNKEFHSIKVWSLPTQFDEETIAFTVTTNLYKDFQSTVYAAGQSLVFAATDVEKVMRITADKFRALQVQFSVSSGATAARPRISGFEVIVDRSYAREEFIE